jgi:hypothetical protein
MNNKWVIVKIHLLKNSLAIPLNNISKHFGVVNLILKINLIKEFLHDLSLFVAKNNLAILIVEIIILQQLILGQIPCVVFPWIKAICQKGIAKLFK